MEVGFHKHKGNVLFLILLAVALFAALSYAVTQATGSGGKNIADEDARLAASQILQYSALMAQTIDRLRLINSCRPEQISFANDEDKDGIWYDTDDEYHNPNAPSDLTCHVFHSNGGALPIFELEANWVDASKVNSSLSFSGVSAVGNMGVCDTSSVNCTDLLLIVPNILPSISNAINGLLGINYILQQPRDGGGCLLDALGGISGNKKFQGIWGTLPTTGTNGFGDTTDGLHEAGLECGDGRGYFYYKVLIPR